MFRVLDPSRRRGQSILRDLTCTPQASYRRGGSIPLRSRLSAYVFALCCAHESDRLSCRLWGPSLCTHPPIPSEDHAPHGTATMCARSLHSTSAALVRTSQPALVPPSCDGQGGTLRDGRILRVPPSILRAILHPSSRIILKGCPSSIMRAVLHWPARETATRYELKREIRAREERRARG